MATSNRIASLDGLRTISIAFVIFGHYLQIPMLHGYADFGVRVFFVISGYLITRLLLQEFGLKGRISLRQFYIRRGFRIFPAAYVYMLIAIVITWGTLSKTNLITAITYTQNFSHHPQWILGHLWSLAVEEQFYLVWPFVLARFFARRHAVLWGVIVAVPFCNAYMSYSHSLLWGRSFFSVADTLAVGCLISLHEQRLSDIVLRKWFWVVPVFALASAAFMLTPTIFAIAAFRTLVWRPLVHFAIGLTILHCIKREYRLLNTVPIVWLGTLSYSLYLWQQMFASANEAIPRIAFPLNLALAFLAATISYYCVEKPFLKLREHLGEKRKPLAFGAEV